MNTEQIASVKDLICYIEDEIKNPVSLDELSRKSCISKYHLHRLFKELTGRSLMHYVRGRKLSCSLADLQNTSLSVLQIATEYGFNYEQSYIRCFKRMFGITPNQFRQRPQEVVIQQKIDTSAFMQTEQGLIIQPAVVRCARIYLEGIMEEIIHTINYDQLTTNQMVSNFYENYFPLIENKVNTDVYYGLVRYSENQAYSNFYMPAVETAVVNHEQAPRKRFTVPAGEYAVFRYIGFHSPYEITYKTLIHLYNYIFGTWLVQFGSQPRSNFHYEKLDKKVCSDSYCVMNLYFPL